MYDKFYTFVLFFIFLKDKDRWKDGKHLFLAWARNLSGEKKVECIKYKQ